MKVTVSVGNELNWREMTSTAPHCDVDAVIGLISTERANVCDE